MFVRGKRKINEVISYRSWQLLLLCTKRKGVNPKAMLIGLSFIHSMIHWPFGVVKRVIQKQVKFYTLKAHSKSNSEF